MRIFLILLISNFLSGQSYPSQVVSVSQGLRFDGSAVLIERSNLSNCLGVPENSDSFGSPNFYSLGFGGEITLSFTNPILNGIGDDIEVFETTFNYNICDFYPEVASVWVSYDGMLFDSLGVTCLNSNTTFDLDDVSYGFCQYIRIKDISPKNRFSSFTQIADGYDLDGITALNGDFFALSVNLIQFTVNQKDKKVLIEWATASEQNNDYFCILVSKDLFLFNEIKKVSGANNSNQVLTYSIVEDILFTQPHYYLLRSIDFNGEVKDLSTIYFNPSQRVIKSYYSLDGSIGIELRGVIIVFFNDDTYIKTIQLD